MAKFEYPEFQEFAKSYEKAAEELPLFLKEFLLEMAFRTIGKAKDNTPVDTGALRNMFGLGSENLQKFAETHGVGQMDSWGNLRGLPQDPDRVHWMENPEVLFDVDVVEVRGNDLVIVIWNGMDYASHIEYGTPNRPNWKWAGGAHMLTIAIDQINEQMEPRFKQAFKKFLEERGLA